MASLDLYVLSQPRFDLMQSSNDGTGLGLYPLDPNDAGNYTGCQVGSGFLVGTYRDWSACAESSYLGYPVTVQQLRSLSFQDVKNRMLPIWLSIGADMLSNQDVANLYMHIKMHYGNIKVAQRALNALGENLVVDGVAGPATRQALNRQTSINPTRMYNAIWDKLYESYLPQSANYPGFMKILEEDFPRKGSSVSASGIVIPLIAAGIAVYFIKKKRRV